MSSKESSAESMRTPASHMEHVDRSVRAMLDALAAKFPTPGGGAAAALTAATAAALAQMVVNYSLGKKSLKDHDAFHQRANAALHTMREQALKLIEADARAYLTLNELLKLPETEARRMRELPPAVQQAIDAPDAVLKLSLELLELLQQMCGTTNANLRSDVAVAAILAEAAARAAACNVAVNLPLLASESQRASIRSQLQSAEQRAREFAQTIERACG